MEEAIEEILKPVENPSSVFIYRGYEKYICSDYDKLTEILAHSLLESNKDKQLTIDWSYTETHPLIFEIRLKEKTEKNTFDFLMRYFEFHFLNVFQKYMNLPEVIFILAMSKSRTNGLRIYIEGVEIPHDDYFYIYEKMRKACIYQKEDLSVYLDFSSIFPLPSCNRPHETEEDIYEPVCRARVWFESNQENPVPRRMEKVTIQQEDRESFSSQVTPSLWKEMVRGMMPVPQSNATYLHYPTQILLKWDIGCVGSFTSNLTEKNNYIVKGNVLKKGKGYCYKFFRSNANFIMCFDTFNTILFKWYCRFLNSIPELDKIDFKLKKMCPHLKNESSPLETVLKAYERPVYYALYNIIKPKYDPEIIRSRFPFISKYIPLKPPKEASHLTFNTILYCAYRTGEGSFYNHIITTFDWIVPTISDQEELQEYIYWFQKRVYPIVHTTSGEVYSWEPTLEEWILRQNPNYEIIEMILHIVDFLKYYTKLSWELIFDFKDNEILIDCIAKKILFESFQKGIMKGNVISETFDVFGENVPEYYIFNIWEGTI